MITNQFKLYAFLNFWVRLSTRQMDIALVCSFEGIRHIVFIIALVDIKIDQCHGNSNDTPVSVLMLNMIFFSSLLYYQIQNRFPGRTISHSIYSHAGSNHTLKRQIYQYKGTHLNSSFSFKLSQPKNGDA